MLEHLKVAIIRLCMGISNEIKVPMIAINETMIFDNIVVWWQQRNLPKRVLQTQSFEFLIKTVPFFSISLFQFSSLVVLNARNNF